MSGLVALTPIEARVVGAVLGHQTLTAAARAIGRSDRQVRRVLSRPHVREAVRREAATLQAEARERLRAMAGGAVEALGELLASPNAAIRLKAALGIIGLADPPAPPRALAVAVSGNAMDSAAVDALLSFLSDEQMRELRRDLLNHLGIRRPGPEYAPRGDTREPSPARY
jgi:hypothetical protein